MALSSVLVVALALALQASPKPAVAEPALEGVINALRANRRARIVDGRLAPLAKEDHATLPIDQQLDAMLCLGESAEPPIAASPELCRQPGFLEERLRRIALTGIPKFEAEAIQKRCVAK
ncbi:MAG: hypothetical protein ACKOEC_16210 [Acidimicrobiia bacterium]